MATPAAESGIVARWVPPEGMGPKVIGAWRQFYASIYNKYGVTPDQYRDLYLYQNGRFAICFVARGMHPDDPRGRFGNGRRLGVDHNHATGAVRGLLCTGGDKTCNRIIGWLNAAQLERAVDYLAAPPMLRMTMDRGQALALAAERGMVETAPDAASPSPAAP